jgi:ribosomal protein S18 acetylase RimI-like enzyme
MEWPAEYQAKDGHTIRVRHAAYGDAPALHSAMLEVAREGTTIREEPENIGDLTRMIEQLRLYLTVPRMAQLVGELDGQVVGAITIKPGPFGRKTQHWCSISIWIKAEGRGLGVRDALLSAALAWAREQNYSKVVAELFASDEPAIALYREFGFIAEGRQKDLFVLPGIGPVDNLLITLDIAD